MAETQAQELAPLRFVIPLDVNREEDRALAELFADVSNGNLGAVARLLLQRGLASCGDTVDDLLLAAMREQAARNRLRGRPREGDSRKRAQARAKSEQVVLLGVGAEPRADQATPVVPKSGGQGEAVPIAPQSTKQDEALRDTAVEVASAPAGIEAPVAERPAAGNGVRRPVNVSGLTNWAP